MTSGWRHTDAMSEENVMSSLQTKRAIYLTKTSFQLHDILSYLTFYTVISLNLESDSYDRSEVEMFSCENCFEKLCVSVFDCEGKILLTPFGKHNFHLAIFHLTTEKYFCRQLEPASKLIKKVISDPEYSSPSTLRKIALPQGKITFLR